MATPSGLKLVFAGTPSFAALHLKGLLSSAHTVLGVYTQPDRPAGRGKSLTPSPVKQLAVEHQIPVYQPESLKSIDEQKKLQMLNADVMIVVAYGLILPAQILATPAYGCLNVHGSLLPRWRGAAPIQRAIEAGDSESGVTIMQMDEGLDTGDMLLKAPCPIYQDDTAESLHDRIAELGPPALLDVLRQLTEGTLTHQKQNSEESTYAKKLSKQDAIIDWRESALILSQKIRAYNPAPVCSTELNGTRLRIFFAEASMEIDCASYTCGEVISISSKGLLVACGKGALKILTLQLPGKKLMSIKQFCNGYTNLIEVGMLFSSSSEL